VTAGVALSSATAKELPVDTPCFVSFGRQNVQPSPLCYPWSQTDICPPASHIRRHHNTPWRTGMGDDVGFGAVLPGVEHLVRETRRSQEAT
jgi:hypothetical protein